MAWPETSQMARRGVAAGKAGASHRLTEQDQGEYRFVYGPYADPVLRVSPATRSRSRPSTPSAARSGPRRTCPRACCACRT